MKNCYNVKSKQKALVFRLFSSNQGWCFTVMRSQMEGWWHRAAKVATHSIPIYCLLFGSLMLRNENIMRNERYYLKKLYVTQNNASLYFQCSGKILYIYSHQCRKIKILNPYLVIHLIRTFKKLKNFMWKNFAHNAEISELICRWDFTWK